MRAVPGLRVNIRLASAVAFAMLLAAGDGIAQVDVSIRGELPVDNDPGAMIICPFGAAKRVSGVRYGDLYPREGDREPVLFPGPSSPPALLEPPKVSYPPDLLARKIEGFVSVAVWVDENGDVSDPKVVCSSAAGFEFAAIDAASAMKYSPATRGGKPVAAAGIQPFRFELK